MRDLGLWTLAPNLEDKEDAFGFIYKITNKRSGKAYIGKKQCVRKIRRAPLKGKVRKRLDSKESDWKTYTGSSNDLNNDIALLGKESFDFVILEWCNSKFELGYKEIKLQLENNVLLSENFYNKIINCRLGCPKSIKK